jgi:Fur family ferric uptake transcriptional regulator
MIMPARKVEKTPQPKTVKVATTAAIAKGAKAITTVKSAVKAKASSQVVHPHVHDHAQAHQGAEAAGASIGRRSTRPRSTIITVLAKAVGPLTVPEIHARAHDAETGAQIGIATVYRTLNLLVEKGLAQQVVLPSGETRYEAAGHKGHHDHFQCVGCARVFDIDTCQLKLPSGIVIAGGFRVQGHELTLSGLCPDCDKPGTHARRPKHAIP